MSQAGRLAARYIDDLETANPGPVLRKARRDMLRYVGPATLKAERLRIRRRGGQWLVRGSGSSG